MVIAQLAIQRLSIGRPRLTDLGDTFEIYDREARVVGICQKICRNLVSTLRG